MAKAPFDPEDTDWGQRIERRHHENQARFVEIELALSTVQTEQAGIREDLTTNTNETRAIKRDTAAILDLFRGAKVIGVIIAWGVGICAGVATVAGTVWAWMHGVKP